MSIIEQNLKTDFYNKVADLLKEARKSVVQTVNKTMVYTYFEIGRMIVEEEQNGNERAKYGQKLLIGLSKKLTKEFGKGFSVYNLERMRKFYSIFKSRIDKQQISATVLRKSKSEKSATLLQNFELSWSHYLI